MENAVPAATPPKPETLRATLVSEGYYKPTWTTHHYVDTQQVEIPGMGTCWEHRFKCFKTNAIRRWGLERVADETETAEED